MSTSATAVRGVRGVVFLLFSVLIASASPVAAGELIAGGGVSPAPHLPESARARAKRQQRSTDMRGRDAKLRASAGALGLQGIVGAGARADAPGAIYGNGQSGRIPGSSASDVARNFLQAFAPVYGLSAADIQNVTTGERTGFLPNHREVVIGQSIAGRPLYGAGLHLHLGSDGEFVAAVGELYGKLRWVGNGALRSDDALTRAASAVGRIVEPKGAGPVVRAHVENAVATDVAYPAGDEARPAFLVSNVTAANGIDLFDVVVDGISGEILEVVARTCYSQGQVFQKVSGMPQSPQPTATPGTAPPSPNPPAYVSRVTIPFTSFLSGTTLSGNLANVREYQAWTGSSRTASSGNAITSGTADFSFALNIGPGQPDIRNYPQAVGTNLFYGLNYLHDYFYALGFDEAHGNFQLSNGALGGLGNDPVLAFVQLGSGLPGSNPYSANNAFMSTPADGTSPQMGMYVFSGSGTAPSRSYATDSALDPDIFFHEFTHGVTERLGPNSFPYTAQPGAINEGNSDFFALNIQVPDTAPADGSYPVGGYSVQDFTGGIRNYPYSTQVAVNPETYADLGTIGFGPEVHNDGEIWTSALWQVRGALVGNLGFSAGRTRIAQLVIDALQLLPSDPTYVDFRNAILTADQARYAGADKALIWSAFAARGLGALAAGGNDGYSIHVLADTSVPGPAARLRLWEPSFITGETVRLLVDDNNAAGSTVTLTTSGGDHESVPLAADGPSWAGSVPSATGAPVIGDGTLQLAAGDVITAVTTDTNTGGGTPVLTATATVHAPYSISVMGSSMFNAASASSLLFNGDENTGVKTLLFPFAFFGQSYSTVYVNDNGQIAFGFPPFIRQRGIGNIGAPPLLAPFSADLDCSPGGTGIYYYSGADRFTARWQCVEYSASSNLVNVAVNLFPDGKIRFDYGAGNSLSGNDYYTNLPDVATVGLNRGTDTFSQAVPGYDGSKNLANAASVLFTPVADPSIACPATFTDPSLLGVAIKAIHFTEARICVNALRAQAGLAQVAFTPATLSGTTITASAIMDLRNALNPARQLLGRAPVSYGRGTITAGMTILASDLQEIRDGAR